MRSGAEGTIIEEPDSLPRVIWGLESDSTTSTRLSLKPTNLPAVPATPAVASASSDSHPSRSKSRKPLDAQSGTVKNTSTPMQSHLSTSVARPASDYQGSLPPDFMLKHSEPIDLGRLVGQAPLATQYRSPDWQSIYSNQLMTPELVHDLSPDLQEMLFAQERSRNLGLSPMSLVPNVDAYGFLGPGLTPSSSSPPMSLLESLKSSRSPIILEELASQSAPYSQDPHLCNSALEIAHKYHQQQLQHGLLPTPPNSTSPIWPSAFSPYQSGLLSPELLAAAGLSQLGTNHLSQSIPHCSDQNLQLRSSVSMLGNPVLSGRKAALKSLAPSAYISNVGGQNLPPRLAAEYVRRRTTPETPTGIFHFHPLNHRQPSPIYERTESPPAPKAPPNTPYGLASSSHSLRRLDIAPQPPSSVVSSSPTSPRSAQTSGLVHVRSIPLSKLVQRRLSTVPEEDSVSAVDHGGTPSAAGHHPGAGLHLFLSPSGRPDVGRAAVNLLSDTLGRNSIDDKETHNVYSVKPFSASGKPSGPVVRGEGSLAKEASRRQVGNVNTDGGRRGEGGRGRGQRRGGRGKRGRSAGMGVHGAERVDGGLVVKS